MNEKNVFILYRKFLTDDGAKMTIGGIQTYINNLCEVINLNEMNPIIIQFASQDFKKQINGVTIYGVKKKNYDHRRSVFNKCMEIYEPDDIIVFASDDMAVKNTLDNVISIQHGIFWDIPKYEKYSWKNKLSFFKKTFNAFKTINRIKRCKKLVCVDYNFQNWYRTQLNQPEVNLTIIPNFTEIPDDFIKFQNKNKISIIFARRFFEYRGTKIFAQAISKILEEFDNVEVIFAGEGPDKIALKEKFNNNPNVSFINYNSSESLKVHRNIDIAVVPTTGSEGTSLSLLEAMASKCAVISTDVGGLTNIILNKFNGLMISPTTSMLYEALKELIIDQKLRVDLANQGFETVKEAFNKEKWQRNWLEVFAEFK